MHVITGSFSRDTSTSIFFALLITSPEIQMIEFSIGYFVLFFNIDGVFLRLHYIVITISIQIYINGC